MLGMRWFPDQAGGLNRYFGALHHALGAAGEGPVAVVVGPAIAPPPRVLLAGDAASSPAARIVRFLLATRPLGRQGRLVDAHFALYAVLPVVSVLRKLPLIVHFQGPWAAESRSAGRSGRLVLGAKRAIESTVYRRAAAIVVLSSAFKRVLVEDYRVAPWNVEVIAPGVDLDRFDVRDRIGARRGFELEPTSIVALTVRRLVPRMGVDVLLRAWSELAEAFPDAVLLIVGDGPERNGLEDLTQQLGLDANIRFLGRLSDEHLADAYCAADLSVVPSVALEGFGLVTLESLACGTPVIVSDIDGLADVPAQLDPTSVVPPGDHRALVARLRSALDGTRPLQDSQRCRRFAETMGWDAVSDRHRRLYRQVLASETDPAVRVVYLDHVADMSGGELALLRLLPALKEVDVHVILAEDGRLVARLLRAGQSVEVLPMGDQARQLRRSRVRPGRLPVSAMVESLVHIVRLTRRLRTLQPDLVHTNSLKSALYGGVAARLAGVPWVWHLRDRVAADYLPKPAVKLLHLMSRWMPSAVVANSTSTLATLPPAWRPESQVRAAIPSPVLPVTATSPSQRDREGTFVVGMVGRLAPWKGQHVFLEAFSHALGGTDARAVLVGGALFGEEAYEESLRRLLESLGVSDQVELRGHSDDVAQELTGFDVLVHASTIPEPFGQVVAEGMAAGLPVVASAAGGPAELITDGVDGILVAPGDVSGLTKTLSELAVDLLLRSRLGAAARGSIEHCRPEVVADQVTDVYRQVLRDRDQKQRKRLLRRRLRR